jgi:hypothetical protein
MPGGAAAWEVTKSSVRGTKIISPCLLNRPTGQRKRRNRAFHFAQPGALISRFIFFAVE